MHLHSSSGQSSPLFCCGPWSRSAADHPGLDARRALARAAHRSAAAVHACMPVCRL
eukprot:CAMPEP_0175752470 /NCGR_PEP_ID=MMETSP0097-20121207/61782_1 /TAXON_ID=311494 /ORGANISM="Alexandrium monilatum, Strain CCMP3105" /LENGTH=55 /DNA_ID=CAMNT_0017061257 /DNA_START=38 /DNA_END=202 /DNA_ORIENTATION=-